jgi:hypothetical protein
LPKHLNSNSSRFSFDLAGVNSAAQERLLEDKHKRIMSQDCKNEEAQRANNGAGDLSGSEGDMDPYADFDEDDFEERIPGVNADFEDDDERLNGGGFDPTVSLLTPVVESESPQTRQSPVVDSSVAAFKFESLSPIKTTMLSPAGSDPSSAGPQRTPRDADGRAIGYALSNLSPDAPQSRSGVLSPSLQSSAPVEQRSNPSGLGLVGVTSEPEHEAIVPTPQVLPNPAIVDRDDDDLYFSDGLIDHILPTDESTFDESIFDVEKHDFNAAAAQPNRAPAFHAPEPATFSPVSCISEAEPNPSMAQSPPNFPKHASTTLPLLIIPPGAGAEAHALTLPATTLPTSELTHENLSAFHSALALAAASPSNGIALAQSPSTLDGHPTQISHYRGGDLTSSYEYGLGIAGLPAAYEADDDDDDNDFIGGDDDLNDATIIAAANADVLETDSDGFYGQEFNFYASAEGGESAHGGYFGGHTDGLSRSKSGGGGGGGGGGAVASREPNLTPITERSEYSNRNSFVTLQMLGAGGAGYQAGPGLAQIQQGILGGEMAVGDEDMTLSALLKLRRGAWGGSNGSLRSSNGSGGGGGGGSPVLPTPAGMQHPSPAAVGEESLGIELGNGIGNVVEEETEEVATPMGIPPLPPPRRKNAGGHSRTGSGADEVTYLKEADGWVMERKRTSRDGEVEVLGRAVVEGGRI